MDKNRLTKAIRRSSYPFLVAPKNFWIDANDNYLDMEDDMDLQYLRGCLNYLKKHKTEIYRGTIGFHDDFEITDFDEFQNLLKELYADKVEELEINIKNRA